MKKSSLLLHGMQSHFLLPLSYKYDRPLMKPVGVYASFTEKCNYACTMCVGRTLYQEQSDLSSEQWIDILRDLKSYLGAFHINFSGGEPFLFKDIFKVARFCKDNGIYMGVTTNGSFISEENSDDIVELFANLNISLDSLSDETNASIRRGKNAFEKVDKGLDYLKASMKKGGKLPIYIKTVVMRQNLHELGDIVKYSHSKGVGGVMFQPITIFSLFEADVKKRIKKEFWIEDLEKLRTVVQEVIQLKKQGHPCLTEDSVLLGFEKHFDTNTVLVNPGKCYIGYNSFRIESNGLVHVICDEPEIDSELGFLTEHSIKELWEGQKAMEIRKRIKNCKKACMLTCRLNRSLVEKAKIFLKL